MPRYRVSTRGRATEIVASKGRIRHAAAWWAGVEVVPRPDGRGFMNRVIPFAIERVGGRTTGGGRRRLRYRHGPNVPPAAAGAASLGTGLGGLEIAALLMSLNRRLRRRNRPRAAR